MPTPADRDTLRDGHAAETDACRHLERHGLLLIARNYRSRFGEIDLVMRDGESLVFVEVRRRSSEYFGTPAETVGSRKQQRLRATAEHYLQHHPAESQNPCRFDIVAITDDRGAAKIEWLRDAF
ncbi:MAG TPA: YraN family protein [Burkholderiales bacterium]|nr:YraN family protein [Burkholderiales bacterium]